MERHFQHGVKSKLEICVAKNDVVTAKPDLVHVMTQIYFLASLFEDFPFFHGFLTLPSDEIKAILIKKKFIDNLQNKTLDRIENVFYELKTGIE